MIKIRELGGKFQKSYASSLKDPKIFEIFLFWKFFHQSQSIRYTHDSHHLEKYAKLFEVNQLIAKITLINGNISPSIHMSYCSVIYCRDIATFDIALLQCHRSGTNEFVLFISDILLYCLVIQQQAILLQCEIPLNPLDYELWGILEQNACQKYRPNLELFKRSIIEEVAKMYPLIRHLPAHNVFSKHLDNCQWMSLTVWFCANRDRLMAHRTHVDATYISNSNFTYWFLRVHCLVHFEIFVVLPQNPMLHFFFFSWPLCMYHGTYFLALCKLLFRQPSWLKIQSIFWETLRYSGENLKW